MVTGLLAVYQSGDAVTGSFGQTQPVTPAAAAYAHGRYCDHPVRVKI